MLESEGINRVNSLVIKEGKLIKTFNLNRFLSIPYGIKVLGAECLFNQTPVEELIMAESVKAVENNALEGCVNIMSMLLSKNIEYIGRNAFSDCISLRVLTLPEELKCLDFGAFNGCKNLREIKMFNKVENIEGAAFIHTRINIVNYVGSILDWLSINFTNSLSNPLHKNASLILDTGIVKDLVVPAEVQEIKKYAFYGCGSLRSVQIKEGAEIIGPFAFAKCGKLRRVYIPKSVKVLGRNAFSGCENLSITLSESLFDVIKKRKCPVCQSKLPYYENQCKNCNTVFNVYED